MLHIVQVQNGKNSSNEAKSRNFTIENFRRLEKENQTLGNENQILKTRLKTIEKKYKSLKSKCKRLTKINIGLQEHYVLKDFNKNATSSASEVAESIENVPSEDGSVAEIKIEPMSPPLISEARSLTGQDTSEGQSTVPLHCHSGKKVESKFLLPQFSDAVLPLLEGEVLDEPKYKTMSSLLKTELIAYLDRENLIPSMGSTQNRWQYRNLGESLAQKYPNMLWDQPSHRQRKKSKKKESPVYTVFIHRLSQRRKMQRLRQKFKSVRSIAEMINEEITPSTNLEYDQLLSA